MKTVIHKCQINGDTRDIIIKELCHEVGKKDWAVQIRDFLVDLSDAEKAGCGKIIVLTALGQDAIVKNGFKLGADGYLFKSAMNPDEVLSEVKKFLGEE